MQQTTTQQQNIFPILEELGEWMALGFYEGLDLPWPRSYGLAWRRLYECMEIVIPDDHYLLPHEPFTRARTRESAEYWHAAGFMCDFNHDSGLQLHREIADEKAQSFPQYAECINAVFTDLQQRLPHFGGYTHNNPDIRRVVDEGFLAIETELDAKLAATATDFETNNLLLALKDYAIGVQTYHQRVSTALQQAAAQASGERQHRLTLIAESFAQGFLYPSRSFLQGLLAVNFTWMLDGCDSLGRLDQTLGLLYEHDLDAGILDAVFADELLDELWAGFERLNGWNIQLGGYTPEGKDGTNRLTLACIAACERNHFRRPNIALRITSKTPDSVLQSALRALAKGSGRPAFYNDDLYVTTLRQLIPELTPEDAREIGFGGCTETMIAGMSNVGSLEGSLNLATALEHALYDGYNPVSGQQLAPHTGHFSEFPTFDAFYTAVQRQIQYLTDELVAVSRQQLALRFHQGDPKLARTLFTRDCVARGKSFEAGGARYNWAVVSYQGIANLIDSLAAIRKCVYEEQTITPATLISALRANYAGFAEVRQLLSAAPKYGNDDPSIDTLGRDIIEFAWQQLLQHETPRGGRYIPSCILFTTYLAAGQMVGATPDGRQAHAVLTDSVGPVQARDVKGPTAMLNSVTRLPLALAAGTPVLNIRLQKQVMTTPEGLQGMCALIRTFFQQGGMQIQVSVLSKAEMLAAQQHPEDYKDLIIRIGGYSEYFTALPKELQDSVIARAEYGI